MGDVACPYRKKSEKVMDQDLATHRNTGSRSFGLVYSLKPFCSSPSEAAVFVCLWSTSKHKRKEAIWLSRLGNSLVTVLKDILIEATASSLS